MIAYIHIDDNTAWRMKYDTTDKKWKKVGNGKQDPKNRKLAAGIATLDAKDRQHFLWGYLKIWIDGTDETEGVGKKFLNGKLSGFATKSNTDDYNDIIDDVEDAVGDIEGTEEDFKLHDSEEEIKNIEKACEITDNCFSYLLSYIKPGMTEKQIADEIEEYYKQRTDGLAFETIVASRRKYI